LTAFETFDLETVVSVFDALPLPELSFEFPVVVLAFLLSQLAEAVPFISHFLADAASPLLQHAD